METPPKERTCMTDDANEAAQPDSKVVFQIILHKNGEMSINSSLLGDKLAMYGLLEAAKDLVREAHKPKVVPVQNGVFRNFLRNGV
jgi:hypothetical protein